MKLVPYNAKNLKYYRRTSNLKILEEFIASDLKCVKIEGYPHKNAKSCASCLNASIRRFHVNSVKVLLRKDDVILLKVDE